MEQGREKYELRSQEVQELLGKVPRWIVRWGTLIVFEVLFLLFIIAKLLSYPDVINSQIILTADVPPAEMKAYTDGIIKKMLISDQEIIEQNQLLAVIHSAANYDDVLWLSENLPKNFNVEAVLNQSFKHKKMSLGSIQSVYADYVNSLEEYQGFIDVDYYTKKANATRNEIMKHQIYINNLSSQSKVLKEEFNLNNNKYKRDSILTEQGVLSKKDLEKSEEEKLSSLYRLKEEESKLSQANIEVAKLEQTLLELELQLKQQNQKIYSSLKAKFENLIGAISQWKKDYLIISPFDGRVSMSRIWSENQYVKEGEVVLTILPMNYERILGRVSLKPTGAGKIKNNNRVIIRFDNYPSLEYGVVTGRIASMSLAPEGGMYYASVILDSTTLVTNYNTKLNFSQNMQGSAEIITESRSLLDRIVAPLKSAIEIQQMYNEPEKINP